MSDPVASRFELGVNYWPRGSAMDMWRELDLAEVREDMARIAGMGFDTVRVFALTRDFLPAPCAVSTKNVSRLVDVARAVADAGLRVVPTLIVLNMSGRIWWPAWMLDSAGRPGDIFADPTLLRSQEQLVEACATALAGDPSVRAMDLTNEIDDAQRPRSREDARRWMSALATVIKRKSPGTPVQMGAHLPSLTAANNMRVDDIGAVADEDVMHAYPLYSRAARSFLDPDLVPFACALTGALSGRGRAPLMQEFGVCTAPPGAPGQTITDDFLGAPRAQYLASEQDAATYYDQVLARLAASGAAGAYAWCYGDYNPSRFGRAPLDTAVRERTFGLVRANGTEKPAVAVLRRFSRERPVIPAPPPAGILDVTADEYYSDPARHFDRLYARWLERQPAHAGMHGATGG